MPVNGNDAAEPGCILDQRQHRRMSLLIGQVHIRGIKQSRVHDVQRQLQQMIDVGMLENLSVPARYPIVSL